MDILIEQDFFEVFMQDYFNQTKPIELEALFTSYCGIKLHTNMSDDYILSQPILKALRSHNKSLYSKEDFILKSNSGLFRGISMAFCSIDNQNWKNEFEHNGGLYFQADTYKEKIA